MIPGERNLLTDVAGLRVGHAEESGSGVTVVICDGLMKAGVDVRGGGPATRETDALRPDNLVGSVHGLAFSGGSVFGLSAGDGLCRYLSEQGVGLSFAEYALPVAITPGACIYDLGQMQSCRPLDYAMLARAAAQSASEDFALGSVGAGTGATAGELKGGVGSASIDLGDGIIVAALIVANPAGSTRTPCGKAFWAWPFEIDGEFGGERPDFNTAAAIDPTPVDSKLSQAIHLAEKGRNTAVGVVATTADLSSAEAVRVATMAQDGLARAIRPSHTMFDGDTIFALATAKKELRTDNRPYATTRIGAAAADCAARSVARAVYEAGCALANASREP